MISNRKVLVRGSVLFACLVACGGRVKSENNVEGSNVGGSNAEDSSTGGRNIEDSSSGGSTAGVPVPNKLRFRWEEAQLHNFRLQVYFDECRDPQASCYWIRSYFDPAVGRPAVVVEGDLSDERLAWLETLVTPEQLEKYEEIVSDDSCSGRLYHFSYNDSEGKEHGFCAPLTGHLDAETQADMDELKELTLKLLEEGTPVEYADPGE
jgi:hypothetical protein